MGRDALAAGYDGRASGVCAGDMNGTSDHCSGFFAHRFIHHSECHRICLIVQCRSIPAADVIRWKDHQDEQEIENVGNMVMRPHGALAMIIPCTRSRPGFAARGSYSITSSARTSNRSGTVMPRALAVFRLIASAGRSIRSTGRSGGCVPERMFAT